MSRCWIWEGEEEEEEEEARVGRESGAPKGGPRRVAPKGGWVGGGGRVPNFCIVSFDRPHFVLLVEFRNERE